MPAEGGRGWGARLIRPRGGYSRGRRVALGIGAALTLIGVLIAVLAPGPPVKVPRAPSTALDASILRYVRELPEDGARPLLRPVGVAVGEGRVYVADSDDGVVRVFSALGAEAGEVGRGVLDVPAYVAYDASTGALLVSDRTRRELLRFAGAGASAEQVRPSTEPTAAWQPLGVDADGGGRIAVTDASSRHRVFVLEADETVALEIGGPPSGDSTASASVSLDFPNSVLFAGDQLWVGDSNNRRVLAFDARGNLDRVVGIEGIARGMAYLPGRGEHPPYVAFADVLGSQVILLDLNGDEAGRFGEPGASAGQLAYPNDVAYDDASGLLYVADTGNARVQVWEVVPAEEGEGDTGGGLSGVAPISAMRLAGLSIAAVGLLLLGAAAWPRSED